jgi:hypothetical protein
MASPNLTFHLITVDATPVDNAPADQFAIYTVVVDALVNGIDYTFELRAANDAGGRWCECSCHVHLFCSLGGASALVTFICVLFCAAS